MNLENNAGEVADNECCAALTFSSYTWYNPTTAHASKPPPYCDRPLQSLLILYRFVCRAFGHDTMRAMLDSLRDVPPTIDAGSESAYARTLYLNPTRAAISLARDGRHND